MKTIMYVMSNDAKWMEREENLLFTPYPGTDIDGITGGQALRINGMAYNVAENYFKLRLSWLSPDPLTSAEMVELGWKIKT